MKLNKNKLISLGFLLLLFCIGCKPEKKDNKKEDNTLQNSNKYKLELYDSGIKNPTSALKFMRYLESKNKLDFQISNFELGKVIGNVETGGMKKNEKGNHIHLIIDNEIYENHYSSNFDLNLGDGSHYLVGFLADQNMEGIKNMQSARASQLIIDKGKMTHYSSLDIPTMIYHLPKGEYVGTEAEKIMLDFQLFNCNLGTEFKVKVDIDGEQFLLDKWEAYTISGLEPGNHTIEMTLLDHLGEKVLAPYNPSTKVISVLP